MSAAPAPESESAPPVSRTARGRKVRLCIATAVAVIGVLAVWSGFGELGFGYNAHEQRVFAAGIPLFVAGFVLTNPRRSRAVRASALAIAAALACAAWWFTPWEFGRMSLRDAVARQRYLKEQLANPSLDNMEDGLWIRSSISSLRWEYSQLSGEPESELKRWTAAVASAARERFRAIPPQDLEAGRAFEERARRFSLGHPGDCMVVDRAARDWVARATDHQVGELNAVARGDWAAFDRTAHARRALAAIGYQALADETREALTTAEEQWGAESVDALVALPHTGTTLLGIETSILALTALNTDADRFKAARRHLFDRAHEAAQRAATKHIEAREYDAAFAVARAHAVRWNATAALFGEEETKKLDKLRDACAVLARFAEIAGPPDELAPAPREREVAPPPRAKP